MTRIIIALLAFIVAVVLFFGYTRAALDSTSLVKADIDRFNEALSKARELQEIKQSLLSRYNTFGSQDLSRLNRLLPDHVDNVRLVLDLDSMAGKYGMAVQNVIMSAAPDVGEETANVLGALGAQEKPFDSLTMQFSTAGTYSDFVRFMQDLETSLRVVDLVSLSIQQVNLPEEQLAGFTEPVYAYHLSVRTHWLK